MDKLNLLGVKMDAGIINLFGHDINLFAITLIIVGLLFVYSLYKAQKSGQIDWLDLVRRTNKPTISTSKFIHIMGGIIASWIVIKMALMGVLSWEFFATYLLYTASVDGYAKFMEAKFNIKTTEKKEDDGQQPPTDGK